MRLALNLTLCEQVIVEEGTKKVSLINSFNKLDGHAFPFVPSPFCVLATLTGAEGEGDLTLTVTRLDTDQEIASHTRRIAFPDRFAEVRVLIRMRAILFPAPGIYLFTLTADGDWVAHRRIRVYQTEVKS